jgi:murein DD-endopeptidase MepM/ murein hydrolase activator NlpD
METKPRFAPLDVVAANIKARRALLIGGAVVSLVGVTAAIAVAPATAPTALKSVIEQIDSSTIQKQQPGDTGFFAEDAVRRGDTVGSLLNRMGVSDPSAHHFLRTDSNARSIPQQLAPGKIVSAQVNDRGELIKLYFPLNGGESTLLIERTETGFRAEEKADRTEIHVSYKSGEIRSSLFGATDGANIPDSIATQLAEIFSAEIDFHRDLRKGDRFSIAYEMHYLRGQPVKSGRILSATFINDGKTHAASWFEAEPGKGGYYSADGKPFKKAFLRSPIEFSRVTSGFSMRFHPVLKEWRAHKGIDYGAPIGTKVRSTGDAVVEFAGMQRGYGNVIYLRHAGDYTTVYGHLNGFAKGIRKGKSVSQGETIGYVGQTGLASGPHLHYEFRVRNQQVNPLTIDRPTAEALGKSALARFNAETKPVQDQLAQLGLLPVTQFE